MCHEMRTIIYLLVVHFPISLYGHQSFLSLCKYKGNLDLTVTFKLTLHLPTLPSSTV